MGEPAFRPRVDRRPSAPTSVGEQQVTEPPAANNDKAWTEEEERWFAHGEARTRAAEAQRPREEEAARYNAAQAKARKHEEGKK